MKVEKSIVQETMYKLLTESAKLTITSSGHVTEKLTHHRTLKCIYTTILYSTISIDIIIPAQYTTTVL